VTLATPVPDDVEALVLAGPANLDAKQAQNLDQFVMRGGAVVALDGHYRLAPAEGLAVEKVKTGIDDDLAKWGITVGDQLVMDTKSDAFPVPENRQLGNGLVVRELHQLAYPYFVKVDGDQLASGSPITGGLAGSVMHFGSPVKADAKVGDDAHRVDVLLKSSDHAWLSTATDVQPDFGKYPDGGFAKTGEKSGSEVLAVAVTGGFASAIAKPKDAKGSAAPPDKDSLLAHSPPDTRIVVFGSSAFVSDDILGLAQQLDSALATANVELVHDAVDWSLADTDLLSIRSRDAGSRALTVADDARDRWRTANLAIAIAGLVLVVGGAWLRRRSIVPMEVA
jgi:ABC-2 type transport system permease protein